MHRSETIKIALPIAEQLGCSRSTFLTIIWLHKKIPHSYSTPICFQNNGFVASNRASSGDDVIHSLSELNISDSTGFQAGVGIFPLPHRVYKSRSGLHCSWNIGMNLA